MLRELGRRIKGARDASGLTQEEAASRCDVDYKRWQKIEAGSVNVTVRTLARVAEAMSISFWVLVGPRSREDHDGGRGKRKPAK